MAVSDVMAEIETALEAAILGSSGGSSSRMSANLIDDRDQVASDDAPGFQLAAIEDSTGRDSNSNYSLLGVTVKAHHLISGSDTAAIDGYVQDNIQRLIDPVFWRAIAGVHSVTDNPVVSSGDITRIGNVISFVLTVQLRLA